ncbi:MAG: molybdopterin molybdotransferase MoeA [Phenylobacterium sp.]|uniref:molybdopterin molybdotransferase MoeA n=1 Tax=Phenylobacterium sp. TaxID=1871053 RepID=UPI00391C4759
MIGFEEAAELAIGLAAPLGAEPVRLDEARGRILAAPVVARRAAPALDVAAMDGYAVREADLGVAPVRLPVCGESFAGSGRPGELAAGACMRVFTGAPVPPGADRVVMQEDVVREGEAALFGAVACGRRHLRRAGSDFAAGEVLVAAGARLNAQRLVAAAAADLASVEVHRRPKVALLATGDELVEPGVGARREGAIPESVSFGAGAMAEAFGGQVVSRRRCGDELAALARAAALAAAEADVVVVTGGASVGERDFARAMFAPLGLELVFAKVAIKPGKPVWIGRAGGAIVVGLPGNPTSALVTARLFLAPLVAGLSGDDPRAALAWRPLPLARPLEACGPRETFYRARLQGGAAEVLGDQDSAAQAALAAADLLVRRRPGAQAAQAAEPVDCIPL